MQKVAFVGLDTYKANLMKELMNLEALELTDQSDKLLDDFWKDNVKPDDAQDVAVEYEAAISKATQALEVLEKYGQLKSPLFKTRRRVGKDIIDKIEKREQSTEEKIAELIDLNDRIRKTTEQLNKLDTDKTLLEAWRNYDLPLDDVGTVTVAIRTGVAGATADIEGMKNSLAEASEMSVFKQVNEDKEFHYLAMLIPREDLEEADKALRDSGLSQISFDGFEGTVIQNLERIEEEKKTVSAELEKLKQSVADMAKYKNEIEEYSDNYTIKLDQEKVKAKLLKTERTFFVEGWIPERAKEAAIKVFEENECCYQFRDPEEGEEVPVLLQNKSFFKPVEAITEMYSLPAYGSFDPTSIYALFYIIFFGMMFSDACYGIIMTIACYVVLKKFDLEGTTAKMMKLFFYCGISTFFWGAMFGGWFGDFFQVFAKTILGKDLVIKPWWFNPLEDPLKLLIFSLALGVIHIFIAMGIKAYMQIREGEWFEALCDEGFWYFTIIGIILWLAGGYIGINTKIGMVLALIGAAGLLFTGGRHNKGFGKVTGGLKQLYDITSYMSDILSYARILALGLATGVIAQVVNTMGSLAGGGVKGFIILMLVFVVGQLLNFAINALGAFIHASRLQYVEFFGHFYEDGGEPFDPFRKKTQYIRIENTTKE